MKIFPWLLAMSVLSSVSLAQAEEKAQPKHKRLIDVGDLEVKGEIRKPYIQYLDSDQSTRKALPVVAREQLKSYEDFLLKQPSIGKPEEVRHEAH